MNASARRSPEQIVLGFIGAFRERWPDDLGAALAPLADDATYQIAVPAIAPIRGRHAIRAELERMKQSVAEQRHDMKSVGSNGNTVFTERCDWSMRNGRWVPVPLVAVFELDDAGRITAWREYLDLGHVARQHGVSMEALQASLAARPDA